MARKPTKATDRRAAVGYIRVSTEEQATSGISLAAQEERVRAYCTLQGLELVALLCDEGVSASKPLAERPRGREVVAMLDRGEAQHVVSVKLDRLFRSAIDCLQRVSEWDDAGVAMHLIDHGGQAINTGSAMGKLFLTMMAGMAEWERNVIGERTVAALAEKKRRGEHVGSPPLGFAMSEPGGMLEPHAQEMEAVRLILRRRRGGKSFRSIVTELEVRGFPTKRGGKWQPCTVRKIWENRARYQTALAA